MNRASKAIKHRNGDIRKDFNMALTRFPNFHQAYLEVSVKWDLSERQVRRIVNGGSL